MSYIRKEYRRLLDITDKQFTIPDSFNKFIQEKEETHNLIIKSKGGNCSCTNCNHEFISTVKINKEIKCPNCKQLLLIKTDRLTYHLYKDDLQLLDKIEDNIFVLRTFEMYSTYDGCNFKHITTEYMRTIIKDDEVKDFVSNQVYNKMGYMYISHWQDRTHWRIRNQRWSYRDVQGFVCPYNIKVLLKTTELKYSMLDKFAYKMQNKYIDFIEYFTKIAKYPSFELLVKLKLFDLAKEANMFYQGKSFQEIMGIPKSFYPFIKKHNIDYKQLEILQLIQLEDIKLIKALTKFDISTLKAIAKFVPLEKAYKNILRINKNREHEYRDYLRGCLKIGYDMKSKKVLYPANLRMAHDKVSDLLIMVENEANDRLIKERCLSELNNYIYKSKKFIIFPANSVESLVNESRQQKHCVRDYCSDYAVGETDIYFMRLLAHQDKSLVTIEVQDKKVVQSRIFDNEDPTKEQMAFINRWQNRILLAS